MFFEKKDQIIQSYSTSSASSHRCVILTGNENKNSKFKSNKISSIVILVEKITIITLYKKLTLKNKEKISWLQVQTLRKEITYLVAL